jgi:hypothetical protein
MRAHATLVEYLFCNCFQVEYNKYRRDKDKEVRFWVKIHVYSFMKALIIDINSIIPLSMA